jgi:hypothetical protein
MRKSETCAALFEALAKAQGELHGAVKDSKNSFLGNKYADLKSCWEALREPLSRNGLSVIQTTEVSEKGTVLVSTLAHKSGEFISGEYPLKPIKDDPQGIGSAMTYARRYSLAAITGLFQVDDDAEAAMGRDSNKDPEEKKSTKTVASVPTATNANSTSQKENESQDHEHRWLPSKFKENEEWCTGCKKKRAKSA